MQYANIIIFQYIENSSESVLFLIYFYCLKFNIKPVLVRDVCFDPKMVDLHFML